MTSHHPSSAADATTKFKSRWIGLTAHNGYNNIFRPFHCCIYYYRWKWVSNHYQVVTGVVVVNKLHCRELRCNQFAGVDQTR